MATTQRSVSRRGSHVTGTIRYFLAFGLGLVGVLFLMLGILPLATGRVASSATTVDLASAEEEGFPDAEFLEVTNGNVVFAHARVWISERDGSKRLFQLTAPVVSDAQLAAWERSLAGGEPLDLSGLRLVAVFTGEQVASLWPQLVPKALSETPLDLPPARLSLTGDTTVAKGQLSLPLFSAVESTGLDWSQARRLRYGRHEGSPWNVLKHFAVAAVLLALSFLVFRHQRRHPTAPPPAIHDVDEALDELL